MTNDQLFRWFFLAIFLAVLSISGYFRRRARQSGALRDLRNQYEN